MITANKGEWSELYVLFKLFAEREIAAANKNLQPTGRRYIFLKVFRENMVYNLETDFVHIFDAKNNEIKSLDIVDLPIKTKHIFNAIKESTKRTFSIDLAKELMDDYLITKIKAPSKDKSDIIATLSDNTIVETDKIGFSIKSQIGGASTLLNASAATNFIYKIYNFAGDINLINSIKSKSKVRDRLKAILAAGGQIKFEKTARSQFNDNLRLFDSFMPEILSGMLLDYYLGLAKGMTDLCHRSKIDSDEIQFKMKNFLRAIALGMVPNKKWDTRLSTYGGYIIVREDGVLLCYHLYNDDDFKDYLFENTKFDTPSSTRHDFGKIYSENGELFIKLNLQIRFSC